MFLALAIMMNPQGGPVDAISAALIIADKTDVRRNRVQEKLSQLMINLKKSWTSYNICMKM